MDVRDELVARIDALLPGLAARNDEDDARGQVSDDTIADLSTTGVFALLSPKSLGGLELDLATYSRVIQKISAVSPSAGWVTSFLCGASWRLLAFSREGQSEIFGSKGYALGAGTAAPITGVKRVDGGYRLTGRTSWNSGSSHADWIQMNGLFRPDAGLPKLLMFAMPIASVELIDNWQILGMKATASRDILVNDVFVPDHRTASFPPALEGLSAGHRLHANPMYHVPFLPIAMIEVLPVVVGTHRGAANALRDRIATRMGTLSGAKAAEKVPAQIRMAHGLARADMAERLLAAFVADISAFAPDTAQPVRRAAIKLQAAMITSFCLDSVNEMARSVGGDAFRDEAPFQRYFRDINTVARHAFLDPDTAGESYGKLLLGLPISDPLI